MTVEETIKKYIEQEHLLDADKHYLVALSGGADSVCLLRLMLLMGYQVEAVHCNFHLRGEESNRDEDFVKDLCEKHNIQLHLIHFDTITYAKIHKVSLEMAARDLRYKYFEQLRHDIQADGICVAHHQDDSVETILMNLIRGTGIHGLTGIKPRNGYILRPLLCVSRSEIIAWLDSINQDYVTDSSNLKADVTRNKVRLNLMPLLRDLNPSAASNILTTARRLQEVSSIYNQSVNQAIKRLVSGDSIDIQALRKEPSPESILFEWLSLYGFSPAVIEQISQSLTTIQPGREWTSETHQMTNCRGRLFVEPKQSVRPTLRIPEAGTFVYDDTTKIRIEKHEGQLLMKDCQIACLDASIVRFPLTLRPTQQGDRFQPFGMTGTQLISDYLTNRHISVFEKRRTLVLCDTDGNILWLVGHRPAAPYCILPSTAQTLVVRIAHNQD